MTNPEKNGSLVEVRLTQTQLKFLEFCKEFGWGKLEVTVKDGLPVMSRELVKEHKHD